LTKLTIIIPVYNEAEILSDFLADLFASFENSPNIEVLLCDGGSSDSSVQIAKQFPCKIINSPAGRARQMNTAAAEAKGEWLVFVHADTSLPDHWMNLVTSSSAPWGRFDIKLEGNHQMYRIVERLINWRSSLTSVATGDQVLFFRQDFFRQLNGYENIPLMEDIAISKAARKKAKPLQIRQTVITSSRRWQEKGVVKTILTMWILRLAYWLGVSPHTLHRYYYPESVSTEKSTLLQIFARPPVEGKVKTRLIPDLGVQKATRLYSLLLQQTQQTVSESQLPCQLWLSEAPQDDQFEQGSYEIQQGEDLGQRMFFALDQGLKKYDQVILIGSDCAEITTLHFSEVSQSLLKYDVVLIPAHDGGYVLIACRKISSHIFSGITWSSDQVLKQTLERIKDHGFSVKLHDPLRDIDTIDDLKHYPHLLSRIES